MAKAKKSKKRAKKATKRKTTKAKRPKKATKRKVAKKRTTKRAKARKTTRKGGKRKSAKRSKARKGGKRKSAKRGKRRTRRPSVRVSVTVRKNASMSDYALAEYAKRNGITIEEARKLAAGDTPAPKRRKRRGKKRAKKATAKRTKKSGVRRAKKSTKRGAKRSKGGHTLGKLASRMTHAERAIKKNTKDISSTKKSVVNFKHALGAANKALGLSA